MNDETTNLKKSLAVTERPEVTDELLGNITDRIVQAFHPVKVILFGSYAYGQPSSHSDIDLLVIMDSDDPSAERIRKLRRVAKIAYLPLDVLVRTPAEVDDRLSLGDFFVRDVMTRGRLLYERDAA